MKRYILILFLLLTPLLSFAASQTLQAGDILYISLPGEKDLNQDFPIDEQGRIILPEVGSLELAGKTFKQGKMDIHKSLSKVHRDLSHLQVLLKERKILISVLGHVSNPGKVELPNKANIQMAVSTAGGLLAHADTTHMQLKRGGKTSIFDYKHYLDTGDSNVLPKLTSLDVIFVPTIDEVKVMGAVNRPGSYEWNNKMNLLDILARAGGPSDYADQGQIKILTGNDHSKSQTFNLEKFIQQGGNINDVPKIHPGNTIIIPELLAQRTIANNKSLWVKQHSRDSIYVFGAVGRPGRYRFDPEMSFLDILSAADGPTRDADMRNVRVVDRNPSSHKVHHVNLSMYFETGNKSLLPSVMPGDSIYIPVQGRNWLEDSPTMTIRVLGAVGRPGRYHFNGKMTILDMLAEAGGPAPTAYVHKILVIHTSQPNPDAVTFNLMKFSRTGNMTLLPRLHAGDTIYVLNETDTPWYKFSRALRDITDIIVVLSVTDVI